MRGTDMAQEPLFRTTKLDNFAPEDYSLRATRGLSDQAYLYRGSNDLEARHRHEVNYSAASIT